MAAHVPRLCSLFTAEYAKRINAQIVYPAQSVLVKPNELESALARPLHLAYYEPAQTAPYLAATLSYGVIKGHPFMDGNKRTGVSRKISHQNYSQFPTHSNLQHFFSPTNIFVPWACPVLLTEAMLEKRMSLL